LTLNQTLLIGDHKPKYELGSLNLTTYVTRHTWASLAKFAGVAPAIIGESLGHSDLKTTQTYLANFENEELDNANDLIVG